MSKKKLAIIVIGVLIDEAIVVQAIRVRGIKKRKHMEQVGQALELGDRAREDGRFPTALGQFENALKALEPIAPLAWERRRRSRRGTGRWRRTSIR